MDWRRCWPGGWPRGSSAGARRSTWPTCVTPSSTPAGSSSHYDGWTSESKAEFLEGLGAALALPDHYGRNFDALADCLTDVVAGDTAGTVLLWDGWGPFARAEERAFSVALSVLGTRVHAERGGPFAVLLRGDGPEPIGVPDLD